MTWGRRRSGGRFPGLCKNARRKAQNVPTMGVEWTIVMQPIAVKIGLRGGDVSLDTLPNSRNLDEGSLIVVTRSNNNNFLGSTFLCEDQRTPSERLLLTVHYEGGPVGRGPERGRRVRAGAGGGIVRTAVATVCRDRLLITEMVAVVS